MNRPHRIKNRRQVIGFLGAERAALDIAAKKQDVQNLESTYADLEQQRDILIRSGDSLPDSEVDGVLARIDRLKEQMENIARTKSEIFSKIEAEKVKIRKSYYKLRPQEKKKVSRYRFEVLRAAGL